MRGFKRRAIAALLMFGCFGTAWSADVGIASFNLAWAGTLADFSLHVAVCSALDKPWCSTRAKIEKGASEPTASELARAEACQASFDDVSGGAAQGLLVAPCNAYKLTPKKIAAGGPAFYEEKLGGLQATVEWLTTQQQVDVIAFQEVRSDEVLQTILGVHRGEFDTCVAAHSAFQTVGFAWRKSKSSTPGVCTPENALAIKEKPDVPASLRSVRPGLTLQLTIEGRPVSFLNVHLKSSCANLLTGGGFPGRKLTDADPACQVLNRQVVPLENWIERVAAQTPLFVVLGDFNRKLDEEQAQKIKASEVRGDHSAPSGPNQQSAYGAVSTRYLWQEISDGQPSLVQVPLSTSTTGCKGFVGLDHILISEALNALQTRPLSSEKLPVASKPKQAIATSDHCPRVTGLKF